jgi:hypothetical protein
VLRCVVSSAGTRPLYIKPGHTSIHEVYFILVKTKNTSIISSEASGRSEWVQEVYSTELPGGI